MASTAMLVEAQADFSFDLLREAVRTSPEASSVVLSPISVAIALAMAYVGARGRTAAEISEIIAKGEQNSDHIHAYFGSLLQSFSDEYSNNHTTLEVANRIYVQAGFPLLKNYTDSLNEHYLSQFQTVNFARREETAQIINNFVEAKTHKKIRDLVYPSSLALQTSLILINAIYFKGAWASKFDPSMTEKRTFHTAPGIVTEATMMRKLGEQFLYHETPDYQVLALPYENYEVFMVVILPQERFGLEAVLDKLSAATLVDMLQPSYLSKVDVTLPKFKLESTHELMESLKKLGMPSAFDKSGADFTGISSDAGELYLSEVIQKASIEINEEGSEAAAATKLRAELKMLVTEPSFYADHPFAYCIVDVSGTILFNGVVNTL